MKELSDSHVDKVISYLEKGKPLPEHYKEALISDLSKLKHSLLFDTKKEYELIYADKEREEDILADTMAVPLQKMGKRSIRHRRDNIYQYTWGRDLDFYL